MDIKWRGLMIDTVRHMPSVSYLYKTIDRISALGLRQLHLHLSDDQGFRIEIKKYPLLNSIGSFRKETVVGRNFPSKWTDFAAYIGDGKAHGGYYTQDDIKSLVAYAKQKKVDLIPEIDIPGHMTAILASYPQYSAGPAPSEVATYWGKFDHVISYNDQSISFLKDIFDEVCEMFQSDYVHIGGDEIGKKYYDHLSHPFQIVKEIMEYLNSKGKTVIVWEEVASVVGGTNNIVMNWKNIETGYALVSNGVNVIFCPRDYFYFDKNQKEGENEPISIGGLITLETIDSFKFDETIKSSFGKYILGIQANLWTEYMYNEDLMDYMLYPRLEHFARLKI